MSLPKTVRLGPYIWTIKEIKDLKDGKGQPCWGLCRYNSFEVQLEKNSIPSRKCEILLHEFTHAILDLFGEGVKVTNERCANSMGKGLIMLFRDNPKLVKYIQENA